MAVFPIKKTLNTQHRDLLSHIFPTKQEDVDRIISYAQSDKAIKKVVVFGSAVTWGCGVNSDIDIAIQFYGSGKSSEADRQFSKALSAITSLTHSDFDLINYDKITNEHLKKDIDRNGVTVYADIDIEST